MEEERFAQSLRKDSYMAAKQVFVSPSTTRPVLSSARPSGTPYSGPSTEPRVESNWVRVCKFAAVGTALTSALVLFALVGLAAYAFNTKRAKEISDGLQQHAQTQINLIVKDVDDEIRGVYAFGARGISCFLQTVAEALREFNPLANLPTQKVKHPNNCGPCAESDLASTLTIETEEQRRSSTQLFLEY